jgi:hypothetical protein
MSLELKIGIVLNYKSAEKKKDELYCVRSKERPWLAIAEYKEYTPYTIQSKGRRCIPADVAIGVFLESLSSHRGETTITVDYIRPDEISIERFKQNDVVYIIIYDLLEAFHLSDRSKFENFKNVLKHSPNVYPPYEYQKFINNKCAYYKYLANKNIPVAPTYCITKKKWLKRDSDQYVSKVLDKVQYNNWKSIITKPVYGQESKDFSKFVTDQNIHTQHAKLKKYLSKNIPKYKSIVIQEYIPGFDKSNPEYRTYFIDGVYAYTVVTTDKIVESPYQEGGKYKVPQAHWNYILKFSQKVMDSLPKFDLPTHLKSPILTRIDIGTGLKGAKYSFFVNEVEFVPSLYIEDHNFPVVEEIAKSLMEVAFEYRFAKSLPIKVRF